MSVPKLEKIWAPNENLHAITAGVPWQKYHPDEGRVLAAWNETCPFSTKDLQEGVVQEMIEACEESLQLMEMFQEQASLPALGRCLWLIECLKDVLAKVRPEAAKSTGGRDG